MRKIAGNPYPGRRAFKQEDHDHFRGRDVDTAVVVDLWTANRLTIVTGPVASGKTSLLRAGVYPVMQEKSLDALPVGSLSGDMTFPFAALPEHNPYTFALLSAWAPTEVPTRLAGLTVTEFLQQLTRRHDRVVFAAIDQVEDIAIDADAGRRRAWRERFLADLSQAWAAIPRLHLLLVARAEAFDTISRYLEPGVRYDVRPLSIANALRALVEPAIEAGRTFAAGAADRLIDDLRTNRIITAQGERHTQADRVEPALLQAVGHWLWRTLPADTTEVTDWEFREYGDPDKALAAYCAEIISEVAAENDLSTQRLQSWLEKKFVTDSGARGAAYRGLDATADLPNSVAQGLADHHLLSIDLRSSVRWYQLLSDRLIEPLLHPPTTPTIRPTARDWLRAAQRHLALGEIGLAREFSERTVHNQPSLREQADAQSILGNVAYEQGELLDALGHYRQAAGLLEAVGDTGAAVRSLAAVGQIQLTVGSIREAVATFRTVVERAPNDLVLQTQLALATWQFGEGEAAVAILNGVLTIDGGNREALRARGEILADLGDARSARLDLERQSVRDRASARAAHGLALAELGDHLEATREIHAAITTAPRDGRVLFYAARASALNGDELASWELARRAVDATDPPLSPSHREVALKLAGHK
ncbi:MAG TPA: tetratricopeptide repeat protein [Trebonia sp.]|nr:tetratricopeptide repeat protein [Trebonia sp.]